MFVGLRIHRVSTNVTRSRVRTAAWVRRERCKIRAQSNERRGPRARAAAASVAQIRRIVSRCHAPCCGARNVLFSRRYADWKTLARPVIVTRSLFEGGGRSGALMQSIDWTRTPLGPTQTWPESLRAIIPTMLASRFAMRVVWGPEYVMLYNDAYMPVLGRDKHPSAMGAPTSKSFPELWHIVEPLFLRVYAGEAVALTDTHLPVHRNGYLEECYFTLSYSPMRDDAGTVAGLLGVISETTERVLAERRLRTLRALAAHAASAGGGALAEVASRALAILGEDAADVTYALVYAVGDDHRARLIGRHGLASDAPAAAEMFDIREPEALWPLGSAVRALESLATPAERYGPLPGGIWAEPSPRAAILPLQRLGLNAFVVVGLSARRAFDSAYADFLNLASDQLASMLAGARAHEREQAALAEAHRQRLRLESLFQQAPAAICVMRGPEHVYEFANPRYLALVGNRDVVGKPLREALPDAAPVVVPLLNEVFASARPYSGSELAVTIEREGRPTECFFNFIYQPIFDTQGAVEGIAVVAFDVTEQVRARRRSEALTQALEATNRDLDQFAYVASHDLKAPLRGIATLSEWIEEALGGQLSGETREHMNLLRGRVHRLEALIDGILSYSRAGRVRETIECVDAALLLAECSELLAPPPPAVIDIGPDMPKVTAERVPLQQIFMNLISNALKHSARPDARVEVRCSDAGAAYHFTVRDNGPGIAPEFHERIWGIFQTLQSRDRVEGAGIGLSVVKKLVETRGGQVSIESALGAGATFHVFWPKQIKEFV
jgi:signal transduction histidine kinase